MKKTFNQLVWVSLILGIAIINGCKKDAAIPTVTTTAVSAISVRTAKSGGNITSDGGASVTARGDCWATTANPVITNLLTSDSTGTGTFTSSLTGLNPNTLYYVRAYATNSAGTAYGNEVSFSTSPSSVATLTTTAMTLVTATTAVSGGVISSDGGSPVTVRGLCWGITQNPLITGSKTTDGAGTGSYISNMAGLSPGTTYYVRAYATNSIGTVYGNQVIFNTKVSDIEGNSYNTVKIGNQVWTAENLKTTRYNDNTQITIVTDNTQWVGLTTPAYCWYDNNEALNKPLYGALYNWHAVSSGKLCPTGWHPPTDVEFSTLEKFLGMPPGQADIWGWRGTNLGGQMKSTTGWGVGENGTNTSGFSALPGGYRYAASASFNGRGILTYFWSTTQDGLHPTWAWYRRIDGNSLDIYKASTEKFSGKSVRCIKD